MNDTKTPRLATQATELKKAWVVGMALVGKPPSIPLDHMELPNYVRWQIEPLKRQIVDLEKDLETIGKEFILEGWSAISRKNAVPWLARKHDEWFASKKFVYELGRVHEVEQALGRLGFRRFLECPAYAQVLLQGFNGAAIRHPEYHLARDLALLNNLFLDAEAIADEHLKNKKLHSNETSQSLARSTILACYNLLESFISGLVAEFAIKYPNAPDETIKKLQKPKDRSLKARFEEVPDLVTGSTNVMEPMKSVLAPLFGDYQKRRNAFVHCEPGPTTAKESLFHETDAKVVRETVSLTIQAIRAAWKIVYNTEGPRWLHDPDAKGGFPRIDASLVELRSHSEVQR
jgi:hypothetical protein